MLDFFVFFYSLLISKYRVEQEVLRKKFSDPTAFQFDRGCEGVWTDAERSAFVLLDYSCSFWHLHEKYLSNLYPISPLDIPRFRLEPPTLSVFLCLLVEYTRRSFIMNDNHLNYTTVEQTQIPTQTPRELVVGIIVSKYKSTIGVSMSFLLLFDVVLFNHYLVKYNWKCHRCRRYKSRPTTAPSDKLRSHVTCDGWFTCHNNSHDSRFYLWNQTTMDFWTSLL